MDINQENVPPSHNSLTESVIVNDYNAVIDAMAGQIKKSVQTFLSTFQILKIQIQ